MKFNILITDDNIFNIYVLEMQIKKLTGFDVDITKAANGQEALDEFKNRNHREETFSEKEKVGGLPRELQPINLIFMDCMMPIMDGYQSSKEIKNLIGTNNNLYYGCVIVGCTAKSCDAEEKRVGFEAGMDYILEKPISESSLRTLMNNIQFQII